MSETKNDITTLLQSVSSGERKDLDALMDAVYRDLKRIADNHLRAERSDHTLQPTALVHEAYLKLINQRSTTWQDRAHFFSVASRIIRRILVDHARQKNAQKRGADYQRMALDDVSESGSVGDVDLVELDDALNDLSQLDERQAKIVELRFFGGLTIAEIAEALSMGKRSVDRDWSAAKAWLFVRLSGSQNTAS